MIARRRGERPGRARALWPAVLVVVAVAVPIVANAATGNISTVAGTGVAGISGDGVAAASAELYFPTDVEPTADGGYLIVEQGGSQRVRRVSAGGTGIEYRCRLSRRTTTGTRVTAGSYRGFAASTVHDGRVNGGCQAISDDGLLWSCFVGPEAVSMSIMAPGALGSTQSGPAAS